MVLSESSQSVESLTYPLGGSQAYNGLAESPKVSPSLSLWYRLVPVTSESIVIDTSVAIVVDFIADFIDYGMDIIP